uniref:Nuclear pore localisation protein NPL4 C-terminal domain-containing protein n=1 Tax=Alexandrium monilatum TaxID=311494 RepID=A0A7S4QP37_9DINO
MSKEIAVRLATPAGRSRITVPANSTFSDFQAEVKARTGVEPGAQRFALDPRGQKPVSGAPTAPLAQLGIVNGAQLHLVNQDASIAAQVLTKRPVPVEPEEPVSKTGATGSGAASSSAGASSSSAAPGASSSSAPKETKAVQGEDKKVDPKFQTFDAFLRTRRYDTAALPGSQTYVTAKVSDKGMIKIPPSVSIKQQPYRHVDTLSVINIPEVENFIGYWQTHLLENGMQRAGWLYGYYLEDKNYDEGCRAIMEGIYEPPQEMIGEMAQMKPDPHHPRVDRIAEALGLERIGLIFTTLLLEDGLLLSPNECLRIARLQNEHSTDIHFTKYRLSKFVSCAVRPDVKQGGMPSLFPYMVSDQCCAMLRDGIISDNADRTHCVVREARDTELMPDFLVEGKANKKIATDFFVVRVNDTAPKKHQKMFTHAEFPRENRQTHPQKRDDLKKYFKKIPTSEPSWSRFADFHLILYIAQEIDVDTAVTIAECVRDRQEIPEGVMMIINQLIQ